MKLLENQVAIVSGAASGGRAIALAYAAEGAKVIVSDINESGGQETVHTIQNAGGEASFAKADTSKAADNEALGNNNDTWSTLDA